ncbi:MAG TPA: VOC family protein, partial [Alphaproteobacteria bacterium]
PAGTMPEGRIQFVQHRTPELVWQRPWLDHPNRAFGLAAVVISVTDPAAAAERYSRYLGLPAEGEGAVRRIKTARGDFVLIPPDMAASRLGVEPPVTPWIAGYVLDCADTTAACSRIELAGIATCDLGGGRFAVTAPPALGGVIVFGPVGRALPGFA